MSGARHLATTPVDRWRTLVRERFPPASYLPMVAAYVLAVASFAVAATPASSDRAPALAASRMERFVLAGVMALSFFFRLRLFDEIKDYEVDREVNPTRPLARGLLLVPEVMRVIGWLTALELVLAACAGSGALATHAIAVAYSYLMYREFFIGHWLRPHLTTYAVTHTASSVWLTWSIAAAVTDGAMVQRLSFPVLGFGIVNWLLFNVFEFARKTFAAEEERPNVASYSKRFGPRGAALLTVSQMAGAVALLSRIGFGGARLAWHGVLGAALTTLAIAYAWRPLPARAKAFRHAAGAYIVAFFGSVAFQMFARIR